MSAFSQAVNEAMNWLAGKGALFLGQSVKYDGAAIYETLKGVPENQRMEMPVIEDFQLGFCTGLALAGKLPVCIYPRMDFMLLATNQLVNHLDKFPAMANLNPKVILRTRVVWGPLYAGPQHTQNHCEAFRRMLTTVKLIEVSTPTQVSRAYEDAHAFDGSTLVVEHWHD